MRTGLVVLSFLIATQSIVFAQEKLAEESVTESRYDYTADWPSGRGFEVGDTVPDIPLVDMNGDEIRFSNFLGKRYVLYCWASW